MFSKTKDALLGRLRNPEETKGRPSFERPAIDIVNSNYDPVFTGLMNVKWLKFKKEITNLEPLNEALFNN